MFAKIENGTITDWAAEAGEDGDWRPLVIQYPDHDKRTHQVGDSSDIIEPDKVRRTWTVTARGVPPAEIKAECQRRIIVRTGTSNLDACFAKQLNATMRAIELTRIGFARALTAEETAEAATLQALADDIKALRAKSDALEAMSPIPSDYRADSYWS